MAQCTASNFVKGVLFLHRLVVHYLLVTLCSSVVSVAILMSMNRNPDVPFNLQETIIYTLIISAVNYCFILIGGGVISTIIRFFTEKSWIILISFVVIAVALYLFNSIFPSFYVLIASLIVLVFGIFDALLSRSKNLLN